MVGCLLVLNRIITNILSTQIAITHKNTNIYIENPFSLKGKIMGQTPNQFHNYQINYNISCICLMTKEKYLLFFYGSNTLSLCLTVKEKHLLSHTLVICLEGGNTLLPPLQLSFIFLSLFQVTLVGYLLEGGSTLLSPLQLSSLRLYLFTLLSLAIFQKATTIFSLLSSIILIFFLHYSTSNKASQILLDTCACYLPPCITSQAKIHVFLFLFHALFSLSPQGEPLDQSHQIFCIIVYL